MKRFPVCICLAFLLMVGGVASADSPANATPTAPIVVTTTSDRVGGSIYFDTDPTGAAIWLDNVSIGTGPFTYYTEKTGTFNVRVWKKGYENYTGTVTVSEGKRVIFEAWLTATSRIITEEGTPAAPVATATTIRKSTMDIPTPWPTSAPASPVDPAVIIGAAALGTGFVVIRRR
jgi:hypothetical protein